MLSRFGCKSLFYFYGHQAITDFISNKNTKRVYVTSPINDDDELGHNYEEIF